MRLRPRPVLALSVLLLGAPTLQAQLSTPLDSTFLTGLRWRAIGPANMSGRITDVEGIPGTRTFYVATAAGGIWKSTNAGTTFNLVFAPERVISMGDLAIAPSNPDILYAGTGEEDSRNSISPGGGIFKSIDGGTSWTFAGLKETQTIGRIIVHPTDPNTVWVAALGAIWRENPERGLYKTTDGGTTWRAVKQISGRAGFVDLVIHPTNPSILFAASWERIRGPYFLRSGGPGGGLWKSTDGGETWAEVKGGGFPESMKGRIGLAIARSNPAVMYALVEADTMPNPRPAAGSKAQTRPSGLYRSEDGGANWTKTADQNVRPFYYSQVRVDPTNPDRVFWSSTPVNFSEDGGKTVRTATQGMHVDHHAMWIDPFDRQFMVVGNDGGIGISFDGGGNFIFANTIPIGQFYNISYDMAIPYNVCGGLQDNGSWCGPSRVRQGSITNSSWYNVGGGDGFGTQQDPTDPNIIYATSQGGNIGRLDYRTGQRSGLQKPSWRPAYQRWVDSIKVIEGDTSRPLTPAQRRTVADLRTAAARDSASLDLRWNWNTPYFISPHNNTTLYIGANRVLKSTKRGDEMFPISPDLTMQDTMTIRVSRSGTGTTGGITRDATGAEQFATITALTESPLRAGALYAGTDDGKVWVTRNDGGMWEDLTGRFAGVPAGTYVSRIEASSHDSLRFYITFDNHRRGDFKPYVYATEDFGRTFRSLSANLPSDGPDYVHVLREDPVNQHLLFLGTDVGVYVSTNRGGHWQRFMTDLPTAPVNDLKIHPRDGELIAGTHGRSIWIVDIAPLQQATTEVLAAAVHLFQPKTAYQLNQFPGDTPGAGDNRGQFMFRSLTPPQGGEITYRISAAAGVAGPRGRASIVITDARGDTVRTLTGPASAGLHRVNWNFQRNPQRRTFGPDRARDSIQLAERIAAAIDSLVDEGSDRPALDSLATQLMSGQIGGGRGGGGGGGGFGGGAAAQPGLPAFRERPGEGPVVRAGQQGGGGFGGNALVQALGGFQALQGLLPGGGFGGGGFGGGGQNTAEPGEYLVTVQVAGQQLKTTIKVAKVRPSGGLSIGELEG